MRMVLLDNYTEFYKLVVQRLPTICINLIIQLVVYSICINLIIQLVVYSKV